MIRSLRSLSLFVVLGLSFSPAFAANDLPKVPPGWTVETVMEHPKILHPSVLCFAPDGRLFVAEDPMDMGADSEKPTDRILCFHPDGKVTVFAEGLHAVFGLAYLDGKVYVHHCPKFTVFRDDHGVGKDRKDLIAVTNPRPNTGFNDHIPANMRLGMDGWFYLSTGDKGIYGAVGTDGSKAEIRGGGILRLRPDGSHLEVFSTGTRNHLDVAINAEDEMFTYDNTDDGHGWWTRVTHMVDGGFYGYPWDYKPRRPYTLWMMTDFGGGSPTGALAYNEDAWPEQYRGNVFLSEWGRKQLIRLQVERDGGTYKIAKREDLLSGGSAEFRPVGLAISPDGRSLYVADWNFGGWKQNKPAGRILKVTYTGPSQAAAKPAWFLPAAMGEKFEATTADLIAGLRHPAQSVRLVAQRRLVDRGAVIVPDVVALLKDSNAPAYARWSAIWTLDALDEGKAARADLIALLDDANPSVRRQAARQLGGRKVTDAVPALVRHLGDADVAVRFQVATALGRIGDRRAVSPLLRACEQSDLYARYASFTALNRIGRADPSAWVEIVRGLADSVPTVKEATTFALRDTYDPKLAEALTAFIADPKQPAEARAAAVTALAAIHRMPAPWNGQWWGTQPVLTQKPAGTVEYPGTTIALAGVWTALADPDPQVRLAAVEAVSITRDPQAIALLANLYRQDKTVALRSAILTAMAATKSPAGADLIVEVLNKPSEDRQLLKRAVEAAGQIGGPKITEALTRLAGSEVPGEVLVSALKALGTLKTVPAVPTIAQRLGHPEAEVRTAAVAALAAIGGDPAVNALIPLLKTPKVELRRTVLTSLAAMKNPKAVPALLGALNDPETTDDAILALTATPDIRALDAYLQGLGSRNASLRDASRQAVNQIKGAALPLIESRLTKGPAIPPTVVGLLQQIYATATPITKWQVLGSFDIEAPNAIDGTKPQLEGEWKDATGKPVHWQSAKVGSDGRVNLQGQGFRRTDNSAAFAYTVIESPTARQVEFVAGSDDGLVVWINGEKVFERLGNRAYRADEFRFPVKLKAGTNTLTAKITQGGGPWEFSIAVPGAGTGKLYEARATVADPVEYARFAGRQKGDAERGKAIFFDRNGVGCVKCHAAGPGGPPAGEVGPSLLGVGAKYNRDQLVESILYPSKQILDGYQQTKITTIDGKVVTGVVRGDQDGVVTLLDAEGRKIAIRKEDIEERKTLTQSLMPDGLQSGLTPADFADLVAYLEGLKEKPAGK